MQDDADRLAVDDHGDGLLLLLGYLGLAGHRRCSFTLSQGAELYRLVQGQAANGGYRDAIQGSMCER